MLLVDTSYINLGISVKEAKARPSDILIVFDDEDSAQKFGDFIGAASIFQATDGFLVSIHGYFTERTAWLGLLAEAEKGYKLNRRFV